jgi:hypothetical protein
MATMITTAKLNDVDPQVWLADVLARIADHTIQNLDQLPPWNWKQSQTRCLGDCKTAALVGRDGTIEYCLWGIGRSAPPLRHFIDTLQRVGA